MPISEAYAEVSALREQIIANANVLYNGRWSFGVSASPWKYEVIVCRFEQRVPNSIVQDGYSIDDNNYVARLVDLGTFDMKVEGPIANNDLEAIRGLYDLILREAGKRFAGNKWPKRMV